MPTRFKTVGEVHITNPLWEYEDASAYQAAMRLLEGSLTGLPVFDRAKKLVGKLTEMDLLKALRIDKDLQRTPVAEIMSAVPPMVSTESSLERAVEIMERQQLLRLPVMKRDRFIGSVTRHDLLRAWLGAFWLDTE